MFKMKALEDYGKKVSGKEKKCVLFLETRSGAVSTQDDAKSVSKRSLYNAATQYVSEKNNLDCLVTK